MLERLKDLQVGNMLTAAIAVAALALVTAPSHADPETAARFETTAHVFVPTSVELPARDEAPTSTF